MEWFLIAGIIMVFQQRQLYTRTTTSEEEHHKKRTMSDRVFLSSLP
jgi:hypothetical protein